MATDIAVPHPHPEESLLTGPQASDGRLTLRPTVGMDLSFNILP